MTKIVNIYCDESCHLENDDSKIMVIGGIICPNENRKQIYTEIRQLKVKHNIKPHTEIKWTKVSNSRKSFYKELLEYFFYNK